MSINLNSWVDNITDDSKSKLWNILQVLKAAEDRSQNKTFIVPWDLFRAAKCGQTDTKERLLSLHKLRIIYVVRELSTPPPVPLHSDPVPMVITVQDDSSIVYDPETTVTLNNEFNALYGLLQNQVSDNTLTGIAEVSKQLPKSELKKKLNEFIKTRKLGQKETQLLKNLNDFKPKEIKDLKEVIQAKDIKHLKGRVKEKLKGTDFDIKTIKRGPFNESFYQLEYLPSFKI